MGEANRKQKALAAFGKNVRMEKDALIRNDDQEKTQAILDSVSAHDGASAATMSVVCAHLMAAALMHREPNDRFLAATAIFALSADLLAAADVKFPILTAESDAAVTER